MANKKRSESHSQLLSSVAKRIMKAYTSGEEGVLTSHVLEAMKIYERHYIAKPGHPGNVKNLKNQKVKPKRDLSKLLGKNEENKGE